jgi:hypothetical protein
MMKADNNVMIGESLHTTKHVQSSKKTVERFYDLMLHKPKLAFLCSMTNNGDDTNNIAEAYTILTDLCSEFPTKEKYEAINAAMYYFLRGYKKVSGSDTLVKYSNE